MLSAFSAQMLLVESQEGHAACKNVWVGMLVVTIQQEFCTSYIVAPVVTITPFILISDKIQNGDILVPSYPECPGKWAIKQALLSLSNCETILKIDQHLVKLWARLDCPAFLTHGVLVFVCSYSF